MCEASQVPVSARSLRAWEGGSTWRPKLRQMIMALAVCTLHTALCTRDDTGTLVQATVQFYEGTDKTLSSWPAAGMLTY